MRTRLEIKFFVWISVIISLSLCHQRHKHHEQKRKKVTIGNYEKRSGLVNIPLSVHSNKLGFILGKKISRANECNYVFSPCVVFTALAMIYAGTGGETREDLSTFLEWSGDEENLKKLSELNKLLFNEKGNANLNMVNEIWIEKDVNVLESFKGNISKYFKVDVHEALFSSKANDSRMTINKWVSDGTEHKVDELFPPESITTETSIAQGNAGYFEGSWSTPFDKISIIHDKFLRKNGDAVKVPYMVQTNKLASNEENSLGVNLLELPYDGLHFSMIIAMPRKYDLDFIITSMDEDTLENWINLLDANKKEKEVYVQVPKFNITQCLDLKNFLYKALGIGIFKSDEANLMGMTNNNTAFLSSLVHRSFIEVDEDGTNSNGGTGYIADKTSFNKKIVINRPFLFYIVHKTSKTIVLAGKVMDPSD